MPKPVDGPIRELLTEVVLALEHLPADDRFKVSTALDQVLNSDDYTIVEWATGYLRQLQNEVGPG
jgi:hypothetical protein